ncbi:MAG: hypothetical protein RLZZ319_741 [Actinomycetota bacterium]
MSSANRRRGLFPAFVAVNVMFGTMFAGLAATSAYAIEGETVTENPAPTETTPTTDPTPEAQPTPEPEPNKPAEAPGTQQAATNLVGRAATFNDDGSVTIEWNDGTRDESDPNFSLFENLKFTVSNTENLTYEIVNVSWEGGIQTSPGDFAYDYMQIMQCWDDGSGTADPTHCQFGMSTNGSSFMGQNAALRILSDGEDINQEYGGKFQLPADPGNPYLRQFQVPFEAVNGDSTFESRRFFDNASTNEIIAARTEGDGTGTVPFEIQTSLEAPHLGCGDTISGGGIRNCFLVVVPRGEFSVDTSAYYDGATPRVSGSPLSASAWANRVEFPLHFQSVKSGCPIGADEERAVGNELSTAAFTSWQASLCAQKVVFGFSQIGDAEARRQLISTVDGSSRFALISNPLTAEDATGFTIKYAPITQSAVVIAFNIEYNVRGESELLDRNGRPVTDLVLNQRLLAKLLTQSYQADVADGSHQDYLSSNPRDIAHDPEFLELNPEFEEFQDGAGPTGILEPIGNSDAIRQLWQWIVADDDAKNFLNGSADPWGMIVNKYYRDLAIPADTALDSLPKADLSTYTAPDAGAPYGTFELRPYVSDMYDAAVRTRRADPGTKIVWDQTRNPPSFVAAGAQLPGSRFILSVTDIATATRLKLPMARLTNGSGTAVEPTADSITAAISAFTDSGIAGVTSFNPSIDDENAYPLAAVSYAAVNVCDASTTQLTKYAKILGLAASKGQQSGSERGQLPNGYIPLSSDQSKSLSALVRSLKSEVSNPVCTTHASTAATTTSYLPTTTESTTDTSAAAPVDIAAPSGTFTPDPNSAMKYTLLSALCFGVPFIAGGRVLIRKANAIHD